MSGATAITLIREPRAINIAQIILYAIAAACGTAAAVGALNPQFMKSTIGAVMVVGVGCFLATGGALGAYAVVAGAWWVERIALIIVGFGWAMLLPAALYYASTTGTSSIWLVVALVVAVLCDVFKRYRRIDWAYLDPTR